MTWARHFLIIGAMKAGTSTLFAWLEAQPEVVVPNVKEPDFFSEDRQWRRGWSWYAGLFEGAEGRWTGEASVSYTDPARAVTAADRIADGIPDARLIYLVRHPLERLASEYRHQVQRGRERRPFGAATSGPSTPYAARSRYFTCLLPYIERFRREQILVVRSEDLEGPGWTSVLTHLGLSDRPHPAGLKNVTDAKRGYKPVMRWLFDHRMTAALERFPAPLRRMGRRGLLRSDSQYDELLATSREKLAVSTVQSVWQDVAALESWLGHGPLWER